VGGGGFTNVFTRYDQRSVFLTFIHVPVDCLAGPKHVVYWHNFRTNGIVCKQIHTVVCQTVFIIIVIEGDFNFPTTRFASE
jgi:hypothetical protein